MNVADCHRKLRIVSLIPSATEIVAALGMVDSLIGRSHACDCPPSVKAHPICTAPKFNPYGSSSDVHDRVTELLQSALSVYHVNTDLLNTLQPTHILTQDQCQVCAVSLSDVEKAVAHVVHAHPRIISLQPRVLSDLWSDIAQVADAVGVDGYPLIFWLKQRIADCMEMVQKAQIGFSGTFHQDERPTVACLEWIEPLMAAGNWVPELVEMAGGRCCFGETGQHSPWMQWDDLARTDPDIIVAMPCGYDLKKTRQEIAVLAQKPEWKSLRAVQTGRVYLTDGNQYFNRPGPRLVDSLELLAEIFHPGKIYFGYEGKGWENLETRNEALLCNEALLNVELNATFTLD